MGLFGRLASLIKSNLNDLISKSEDPEKMLNQVILEMNQQLVEAKKQVALSIADEKRLAKQFETERATAEEWERKAMMAVRAGEDELAKEALLRQKEHESLSAELERQWHKQKTAVEHGIETRVVFLDINPKGAGYMAKAGGFARYGVANQAEDVPKAVFAALEDTF